MKQYVLTLLLAGGLSLAGTVSTTQAVSATTYTCTAVSADTVIVLTSLSKAEAEAFEQTYQSQGYLVVLCVKNG